MKFMFSGAPEPSRLIRIIGCLSISGTPDTRVTKGFRIFSQSTRLNNLQSIAQDISYLSVSCESDTRVTKGFGIFSETTWLNNLQSIAQENHCRLLDSYETDPLLYPSNHPGIERLSKRYPVTVPYPKTRLVYSRLN